jgi:hypothetical protein
MSGYRDQYRRWLLKRRLPFYVQLAHACPEDLSPQISISFLTSVREIARLTRDFVGWRHPITYAARCDFVETLVENRSPQSAHEKAFADWQDQCSRAMDTPNETSRPPYASLFQSLSHLLDQDQAPEIDDKWGKHHDGWFEYICLKGDEICEPPFPSGHDADLYWDEEYYQQLDEFMVEFMADHTTIDDCMVDVPEEYSAIVYGDNTDPLPDSPDDEIERQADYIQDLYDSEEDLL